MQWIMSSWQALSRSTIQNGFIKAHIEPQLEEAISSDLLHELQSVHLVDKRNVGEQDMADSNGEEFMSCQV